MSEEWQTAKEIPGFEGLYRIDSKGRIFSQQYGYWKELSCWVGTTGYKTIDLKVTATKKKKFKIHRLLYDLFVSPIPLGYQVDHINRDRLDNRLENLRLATPGQNNYNRCITKGRKTKGTTFYKRVGLWMGSIHFKNRKYHLGYFDTELAAAVAYDLNAIELYGEHAHTNYIKTGDMLLQEQTLC